jgi:hypothetical protein
VSKKHGAKRRSRRKHGRVLCASCGRAAGEPRSLLAGLAAALNACEDAGVKVVLTGWQTVITRKGYVVRLRDREWAARTADYLPFEGDAGGDVLTDGLDA